MDILPWREAADHHGIRKGGDMAEAPKLTEELKKMDSEYEPLLPVEKKLITWSFVIGIGGLALLVWISYTFFPAGH